MLSEHRAQLPTGLRHKVFLSVAAFQRKVCGVIGLVGLQLNWKNEVCPKMMEALTSDVGPLSMSVPGKSQHVLISSRNLAVGHGAVLRVSEFED